MKRLYVSLGLVLLLAALSGAHAWYLTRFTGQLTDLLSQAQAQVEREDWEQAARFTRQAQEQWMSRNGYLHVTLRHTDTDAIQISFDETLAFLEADERQPAEYAASNLRLMTHLELLAEAELPTLTNLL